MQIYTFRKRHPCWPSEPGDLEVSGVPLAAVTETQAPDVKLVSEIFVGRSPAEGEHKDDVPLEQLWSLGMCAEPETSENESSRTSKSVSPRKAQFIHQQIGLFAK